MSKTENNRKLAKVKLALADKCDRLGKATTSVPRQKTLKHQAARFRRPGGRFDAMTWNRWKAICWSPRRNCWTRTSRGRWCC